MSLLGRTSLPHPWWQQHSQHRLCSSWLALGPDLAFDHIPIYSWYHLGTISPRPPRPHHGQGRTPPLPGALPSHSCQTRAGLSARGTRGGAPQPALSQAPRTGTACATVQPGGSGTTRSSPHVPAGGQPPPAQPSSVPAPLHTGQVVCRTRSHPALAQPPRALWRGPQGTFLVVRGKLWGAGKGTRHANTSQHTNK